MDQHRQTDSDAITRRRLLRRSVQLGAMATLPPFLLSACGGDEKSSKSSASAPGSAPVIKGTIVLRTYPGWIGDKEPARFAAKYPGAKIKEVADTSSGAGETIALLARSKGDFDLTLAALPVGGQLEAAGLLQRVTVEQVPNLKNFSPAVLEAYPFGVPGDLGKTLFGYRKDLISEKPESWADFWALTKKYKDKVTIFKYDADVIGAALLKNGHDVNSADEGELEQAKASLIELKRDLRALLDTDLTKPLLAGSAVMSMAYDYDLAAAVEQNDNIVIVNPSEGSPAYLEGYAALKDSKNLDTVYAFMNEHLEPENYGNYINTIGGSYLMPKAEPFIKSAIKDNPALRFQEADLTNIAFERFLTPEASAARAKLWDAVLSA